MISGDFLGVGTNDVSPKPPNEPIDWLVRARIIGYLTRTAEARTLALQTKLIANSSRGTILTEKGYTLYFNKFKEEQQ